MTLRITRRESLLQAVAFGGLKLMPGLALSDAVFAVEAHEEDRTRKATPWNEIGPFYKKRAPNQSQLRGPNDPGLPLTISGGVFNTRGAALQGATIEIWHADHLGQYDLNGYRYRAQLVADTEGRYSLESVMPGHYPGRVCQHVHYLVTAPDHVPLITQLYFASDPVFAGDPDRNYVRDPLILSRELVRPVVLGGDPRTVQAKVSFDLVLERR